MSLIFVWREAGAPDDSWVLSDEAIASLESYRLTLRDTILSPDEPPRQVVRYANVRDLVKGIFSAALLTPAFTAFPPATVQAAGAAVEEARKAYEAAHAAAREAAISTTEPPLTTLTKFQFRSLFTFDELVAVDNYENNDTLTHEQKAQVRTVLENFKAAQDISLTDAATQAGVNLLAEVGLLTVERAAMILSGTAPTTP